MKHPFKLTYSRKRQEWTATCPLGLWSGSARSKEAVIAEGYRYYAQYHAGGEYSRHINSKSQLTRQPAPASGEDDAQDKDADRWHFFASSPQTALMLGSKVDPKTPNFPWREECDRLADAAIAAQRPAAQAKEDGK